ncbi:MAG: RraA family protein [Candidatus Heimdallarchaeota archaeon]
MFVIKERGPKSPRKLIKMLKEVEPATVGHFKHCGFIDPSIRPVLNDVKVVGPAVTVRTPGADSTIVHKVMELVEPGDVIVIDRCGDSIHACWGGMVTLAAHLKGVAGAIVDGPATDINEIIEIGFPLYSKGVTAITTKFLGIGGESNTVIHCGGVAVHPGDLIVADTNGIVVIRPDEAQKVAEKAMAMQEGEKPQIEKLKRGQSLPDITGANAIIAKKMNESS